MKQRYSSSEHRYRGHKRNHKEAGSQKRVPNLDATYIMNPFSMSQVEFENVFRHQYKLSKQGRRDPLKYNIRLDQKVRLQMALLHKVRGDFNLKVDFEMRERQRKQALMLAHYNKSNRKMGKYGAYEYPGIGSEGFCSPL